MYPIIYPSKKDVWTMEEFLKESLLKFFREIIFDIICREILERITGAISKRFPEEIVGGTSSLLSVEYWKNKKKVLKNIEIYEGNLGKYSKWIPG